MNIEIVLSAISIVIMPLIVWYFNQKAERSKESFLAMQERMKQEYAERQKEIDNQPELMTSMTDATAKLLQMYEPQLTRAQTIIASQGKEIRELQSNAVTQQQTIVTQATQIESLTQLVKKHEEENVRLNSIIEDQSARQRELEKQNLTLLDKLAHLQQVVEEMTAENTKLSAKIANVVKDLDTGSLKRS